MTGTRASTRERLERNLIPEPNTGCFLWLGNVNNKGYGTMWTKDGVRKTHRVAYELSHGPIPESLCVCHTCDVPSCCNPDHLFLGTYDENNQDRVKKGRSGAPQGKDHGCAKLTEQQVREIRAAKGTQKSIADRYGVYQTLVSKIKRRVTWKHLGDSVYG
jgi:hypothetical protein